MELFVNGSSIGDHIPRFEPNGEYNAFQATDYVVVDFRAGTNVQVVNVAPTREKIPVIIFLLFGLTTTFEAITQKD